MDDYFDWLKVYTVNGATLGVVSFTEIEAVLKIIALCTTILWTALKIKKLIKDDG